MLKPNSGKEYIKWSGVAMQGIVAIVALLFLGKYIDDSMSNSNPVGTIIGILAGVFYFFYTLFKAATSK